MSEKVRLSLRVRPDSEAPRWVYDEIVKLESERDDALEQIKTLSAYSGERHAFYRSPDGGFAGLVADKAGPWMRACDAHAVEKERDEARARCETERVLREVAEKFHDVAVKERDQARADVARLTAALRASKEAK